MADVRVSIKKGFAVFDALNSKVGTVEDLYGDYFQMDSGFRSPSQQTKVSRAAEDD